MINPERFDTCKLSLTLTVPDGVPSDFHNWLFFNEPEGTLARKNISEPTFLYCSGLEDAGFGPGTISLKRLCAGNITELRIVVPKNKRVRLLIMMSGFCIKPPKLELNRGANEYIP
jgi:hypothetical protein